MSIKAIFLLTTALGISFSVFSQKKIERLKPGDRFPDAQLSLVRNDVIEKVKVSDYKGKKIIIDIWNRWCAPCINSFPSFEKMQDEYQDDLVVLAVTNDSFDEFKKLRNKSRTIKESRLPFVVNDTLVRQLIQTTIIPTYVWINEDLTINAITRSYGLNKENIKKFLKGEKLEFDLVEALERGKSEAKLAKLDVPKTLGEITYYSGLEKINRKSVFPVDRRISTDAEGRTVIDFLEVPALYLFETAYDFQSPQDVITTNKRLEYIIRPADPEKTEDWYINSSYSYQLVMKNDSGADFGKIMQKDLYEYLGIKAEYRDTVREAVLLRKTEKFSDTIKTKYSGTTAFGETTKDSIILRNCMVDALTGRLSEMMPELIRQKLPIFNYTDIKYPIDLSVKFKSGSSLAEANEALKPLGLELTREKVKRRSLILR